MIEAIFFDVDGTLLSIKTHKVPESAMKALYLLREKGIKLFIATGRGRQILEGVVDFDFDGYVTLNGQYCYDKSEKVIFENTLEYEDLKEFARYIKAKKIPAYYVEENGLFCNEKSDKIDALAELIQVKVVNVKEIDAENLSRVYQVSPCISGEQEDEIARIMPNSLISRWNDLFCDIYPSSGTKLGGIEEVCKYYGFNIENVMAFGDSYNDVEMLEGIKNSIAMGNAPEDVKKFANYITDDVDSNGIYNALINLGVLSESVE